MNFYFYFDGAIEMSDTKTRRNYPSWERDSFGFLRRSNNEEHYLDTRTFNGGLGIPPPRYKKYTRERYYEEMLEAICRLNLAELRVKNNRNNHHHNQLLLLL